MSKISATLLIFSCLTSTFVLAQDDDAAIRKEAFDAMMSCPKGGMITEGLATAMSNQIVLPVKNGKMDLKKFSEKMKLSCNPIMAIEYSKPGAITDEVKTARAIASEKTKVLSIECEDTTKKPYQVFQIEGVEAANGNVVATGNKGQANVTLSFNNKVPQNGRSLMVEVNGTQLSKSLSPGLGPIEAKTGWIIRKMLGIDFDIKIKCYPESQTIVPSVENAVTQTEKIKEINTDVPKSDEKPVEVADDQRKTKEQTPDIGTPAPAPAEPQTMPK